jgi:hypothetical protein
MLLSQGSAETIRYGAAFEQLILHRIDHDQAV